MDKSVEAFDFARMVLGDQPPLFLPEIVVRTIVICGYSFLLIRWIGGRTVAQLSMIEFLLVIALGSAYQSLPALRPSSDNGIGFVPRRADPKNCCRTGVRARNIGTPVALGRGTAVTWRTAMTHTDVRRLTLRYFRRFAAISPEVDTRHLARGLEARLPEQGRGPAARALLQHLVSETAARHAVVPKW